MRVTRSREHNTQYTIHNTQYTPHTHYKPPMAILTGQLSSSPSALGAIRAKEQFDDAALLADALDMNDPVEDIEVTLAVLFALPKPIESLTPPPSSPALRLRLAAELGNSHESGSQISAMATRKHLPSLEKNALALAQ